MSHPVIDLPGLADFEMDEATKKQEFRKASIKSVVAIVIMLLVLLPMWVLLGRFDAIFHIVLVFMCMGTAFRIVMWYHMNVPD